MANSLINSLKSKLGNSQPTMLNLLRSSGSSNEVYRKLYNSNPKFRQFADSMNGKTPEQAFAEVGLDFNKYKNLKW